MDVDADSSGASPNGPSSSAAHAVDESSGVDPKQNEITDLPLDPELVKQGLPDKPLKADDVEVGVGIAVSTASADRQGEPKLAGDTDASKSAAGLMALAGGALSYLPPTQTAINGGPMSWSSSESPSMSTLPSLIGGPNSSPTNRDGKHTTLPPLNSITVLANVAAASEGSMRMGDSSRPMTATTTTATHLSPLGTHGVATVPSPPGLPAPASGSSAGSPDPGTPRPNLQHLSVQQRQHYMGGSMAMAGSTEYSFAHHPPHYPPIKDTASPQPAAAAYAAPSMASNSANLFTQGQYPPHQATAAAAAAAAADGRRGSESSEFQYSSDQTTPRGADNGVPPEDSSHPSPQPQPPRGQRAQTGPVITSGFKCEFEGCKAPPFQTQYLLK